MRYIIIPLFLIIYTVWTVSVIQDLINQYKKYKEYKKDYDYPYDVYDNLEEYSQSWLSIHLFFVFLFLIILIVLNW